MKRIFFALAALLCAALCGCAAAPSIPAPSQPHSEEVPQMTRSEVSSPQKAGNDLLLYQGHASLRITTSQGRVIYVDPYAGEGYDAPADLILVTHGHFDHNAVDKVENRAADCRVITHVQALSGGKRQTFALGFATVRAVQAGNNRNHSVKSCVGYLITLESGVKIYVSGDTSTVDEMSELASEGVDYAFFCCDGVYNMGPDEASRCAASVAARHSVPYHVISTDSGKTFDRAAAERFEADGRVILEPGDTLTLVKED